MGVCHGRYKKERGLCKDMYRSSTPQQSTPEATSSIKNYWTGHCWQCRGPRVFSILDAKCGFWQIPLDEASSKLTTFMTPSGRVQVFGACLTGSPPQVKYSIERREQLFDRQPCQIVVDDIRCLGGAHYSNIWATETGTSQNPCI